MLSMPTITLFMLQVRPQKAARTELKFIELTASKNKGPGSSPGPSVALRVTSCFGQFLP
jgi:hypothetical protein